MFVGYCRVSTNLQSVDRQKDLLLNYGCEQIFSDQISGAKFGRSGLSEMLDFLSPNDTVVVTQLDRLGRSLKQLLEVVEQIEGKGCDFVSLSQGFDTRTPSGKMIFSVMGAIAQFERDLIIERTNQGLDSARAKGVKLGRKYKLNPEQVALLNQLKGEGRSAKEISKLLGVSKATIYRYKNGEVY